MTDLLEISVADSEVDAFLATSAPQPTSSDGATQKRPLWPEVPTKCPVDSCPKLYQNFSAFDRHWQQNHQEYKTCYGCPCCNRKFFRRDRATHHLKLKHCVQSTLIESLELNEHYVDPGNTLPFRPNHRLRLSQKRKNMDKSCDLVTARADCRDEEVTFDDNGNTTGKRFRRSRRN